MHLTFGKKVSENVHLLESKNCVLLSIYFDDKIIGLSATERKDHRKKTACGK